MYENAADYFNFVIQMELLESDCKLQTLRLAVSKKISFFLSIVRPLLYCAIYPCMFYTLTVEIFLLKCIFQCSYFTVEQNFQAILNIYSKTQFQPVLWLLQFYSSKNQGIASDCYLKREV